MNKKRYIELIGKSIEKVCKDATILFFGSLIKGNFSDRLSDIDVAVYVGRKLTPVEYVNLLKEFENLPILRRIDLIDLAEVKDKKFLKEILESAFVWKGSIEDLKSLVGR